MVAAYQPNPMKEVVTKLLQFDPMDVGEKEGLSTPETMGLALAHNKMVNATLQDLGDMYHGQSLSDLHATLRRNGMFLVYSKEFPGHDCTEQNQLWWHPTRHWLFHFDTYNADHINGGKMFFALQHDTNKIQYVGNYSGGYEPATEDAAARLETWKKLRMHASYSLDEGTPEYLAHIATETGKPYEEIEAVWKANPTAKEYILSGDFHYQACFHWLSQAAEKGRFVPWVKKARSTRFWWLVGYDIKDYELVKAETERILHSLKPEVQESIGVI